MAASVYHAIRAGALAFAIAAAVCCEPGAAIAQKHQALSIGGGTSVLITPRKPRGSIILMPGGNGYIGATPDGAITGLRGNQLTRTRMAYVRRGRAVLVLDSSSSLPAAVTYMRRVKRPVTVVATSRGTLRAAYGLRAGARPDRLVLSAGFLTRQSGGYENVASIVGSASKLPPTLVIHHRNDACRVTLPAGVAPFIRWARGRARIVWLSGGRSRGRLCGARAHHGFNGLDAKVVGIVTGFAAGRR